MQSPPFNTQENQTLCMTSQAAGKGCWMPLLNIAGTFHNVLILGGERTAFQKNQLL